MACACRCGRSTSSNSLSVYTPVSAAELDEWLRHYSVGRLQGLEPIKAGIENSNFFVTTTQGRYVLTLFERLPAAELPFYLELMAHLARHGIPSPAPLAELKPFLNAEQSALLDGELAFHSQHRFPDLPRGPVHADLFRDNALFEAGRISGVIDFYFAGIDCLLYDVAVCANDWCLDANLRLEPARTRALLAAYEAVRPLTPYERTAWPVMLRAAALRFWLSRLHDFHLPRPGMLVHAHDPEHFRRILECRRAS